MADTKITALTAATLPLDGTELVAIVQGGVSKKVARSDLVGIDVVLTLASTQANSTTTAASVTAPVITAPTGFLTGAAKITVGTTAPSSPSTGDLWVDSA